MSREIPPRWLDAVREHIRARSGEDRDHLMAFDFPSGQSIRLAFPDGSYAYFRYAFYLRDEARSEVAVFTEHCGYHFFPRTTWRSRSCRAWAWSGRTKTSRRCSTEWMAGEGASNGHALADVFHPDGSPGLEWR